MQDYEFYLEFNGVKTVSQNYSMPSDQLVERTIERAAKKFAKRKGFKYIDHDFLINDPNGYRVFYEKKKREHIFYVIEK